MRTLLLAASLLWPFLPAVASSVACPFKAAEVQAALGAAFAEGTEEQTRGTSDIKVTACSYHSKNMSLRVNTMAYRTAEDAQKHGMALAGRLRPVPGDADKAAFQEGQGDVTSPTLWYVRQNVAVELRVLGIWYASDKNKELPGMQQRLLKLRRIP